MASLRSRLEKIERQGAPAEPIHVEIVRFSPSPLPAPIQGPAIRVSYTHHGAEHASTD